MTKYLPAGSFRNYEQPQKSDSFFHKVLITRDHAEIVYVSNVDLIYPDNINEESENFPLSLRKKINNPNSFAE